MFLILEDEHIYAINKNGCVEKVIEQEVIIDEVSDSDELFELEFCNR